MNHTKHELPKMYRDDCVGGWWRYIPSDPQLNLFWSDELQQRRNFVITDIHQFIAATSSLRHAASEHSREQSNQGNLSYNEHEHCRKFTYSVSHTQFPWADAYSDGSRRDLPVIPTCTCRPRRSMYSSCCGASRQYSVVRMPASNSRCVGRDLETSPQHVTRLAAFGESPKGKRHTTTLWFFRTPCPIGINDPKDRSIDFWLGEWWFEFQWCLLQ